LEKKIQALVAAPHEWSECRALLHSIKGIGLTISIGLRVSLPELGRLNRQKITAWVGVVPFN
jgi:hypothetical protein